jgi:nucleotide-binding universal stress UspA family protein
MVIIFSHYQTGVAPLNPIEKNEITAMNTYGSILVYLDNDERLEAQFAIASNIKKKMLESRSNNCTINAYYVPTPNYIFASNGYPEIMIQSVGLIYSNHAKNKVAQKNRFDHWRNTNNENSMWIENASGLLMQSALHQALFADLLIFGQVNPESKIRQDMPIDFVESLIIDSGVPSIIVPYIGTYESVGSRVLIAWKSTREASRALKASIPFLQTASKIDFVLDTEPEQSGQLQSRLKSYLQSNMVKTEAKFHSFGNAENIAERLLSLAAETSANLLVMGCYGHSRLRQFVIGGVSKTILESMTLPVLMVH